jgi:hypothetical protein
MMKRLVATLALAAMTIGGPAAAQTARPRPAAAATQSAQPTGQAQLPPAESMIILIRSTVVALNHANLANNYTVLNALGSPTFRQANSPQQLSNAFAAFRTNHIDMNPVVFLTPQLTVQPTIQDGRMHLQGFFPSQPMRVNFDLSFEPDQGVWKVQDLTVNLQQNTLAAR